MKSVNNKTIKRINIETRHHKFKICCIGDINSINDTCMVCGWEDDDIQNEKPDYMGGVNEMS